MSESVWLCAVAVLCFYSFEMWLPFMYEIMVQEAKAY
jgi:hypothetical protein